MTERTLIAVSSYINAVFARLCFDKLAFSTDVQIQVCFFGVCSGEAVDRLKTHVETVFSGLDLSFNSLNASNLVMLAPTDWQGDVLMLVDIYKPVRLFCYGDGPGIRVPIHFYDPPMARFKLYFRKGLRIAKSRVSLVHHAEMLYLPVLPFMRKRYGALSRLDIHRIRSIINNSSLNTQSLEIKFECGPLDNVLILCTVNFSESGQLTFEEELALYLGVVKRGPVHCLIIKPHPRSDSKKNERIRDAIRGISSNTIVEIDQFLPVELLLAALKRGTTESNTTVIGFSTAILSARLMGARVSFITEIKRSEWYEFIDFSKIYRRWVLKSVQGLLNDLDLDRIGSIDPY